MIKLAVEQLQALAENQLCAEHQTPVVVCWLKEGFYTLRCDEGDHYPDTLMRNPSLTELWKQGKLAPGPVTNNIERGERHKMMSQPKSTNKGEFAMIRQTDLGTGELLYPEKVKAMVAYAYKYHLDPYRGHVVMMYGQPYIGLDGYLFHANREDPGYQLLSWPMTEKEKEQYQVGEYDHGWIAQVIRSDNPHPFSGIGIVTQEEIQEEAKGKPGQKRYPVVANKPWNMAQKRAEWQALRRAFPIGESEEGESESGDKSAVSG